MQHDRVSHILVPVDTEAADVSRKALTRAVALARAEGARLTLLSVVPAWREDLSEVPATVDAALDAIIAEFAPGLATGKVVKVGGSISGRIIQAVAETGADMVIMASHDPRLSDFLIGSNAAHVALHVPVSVMVVR